MPDQYTLLCVDDEPALLSSMAMILEHSGYRVLTAETAELAIESVRREPVDAVILDYFLPGTTGAIVAATMKQLRPDLPIILSTGDSQSPPTENIDAIAHKPCHPQDLLRIVKEVLERSKR